MRTQLWIVIFFPYFIYAQSTKFGIQQDLFDLSSTHYQLNHPIKPIIDTDSSIFFLGFSGGYLTKYSLNSNGKYESQLVKCTETSQAIVAYDDFNNDGKADILSENDLLGYINDEYTKVYLDNWRLSTKTYGDFDDDGLLDLIAEDEGVFDLDGIYYLRNKGDFKFEEILIEAKIREFETYTSGDIDNDGDLDFVVTTRMDNYPLRMYFNDGKGNFTVKEPYFNQSNCWTMNIELFDFDGDKNLDIVMEDDDEGIYIIKNVDNFETFDAVNDPAMSYVNSPLIVKPFDFNYDNKTDIVVFRQTQNTLFIDYYEAKNQYSFYPKKQIMSFKGGIYIGSFEGTVYTRNLNFVDLNNDGKMDITVTAGFDKKQIAVINNSIISKNEDVLIEDFEVAPNIISDYLNIDLLEVDKIKIVNSMNQELYLNGGNERKIDISWLPSGVYFLKISTKSDKYYKSKFVKI